MEVCTILDTFSEWVSCVTGIKEMCEKKLSCSKVVRLD